ncbi:hypothetical protein BAE36_11670 [Rhizobium leguminosarum bv. trifolii]|jgi:hypothetical protein|uniref:Uncharacterized protein n=1 Tax=Rhizobium leguminosarum bv. trifolii TaxID=386 RepID=A0A1B8RE88_RHILT|nr:hypothetical protein [Rhizobium leguminosarum bv. trifolii]OBY07106.1 hypothetical protein BAE36_11670 [Rhizobium leguminosarum bv. trifolii]
MKDDLASATTREARRISSLRPIAAAFLGRNSGFVCAVASAEAVKIRKSMCGGDRASLFTGRFVRPTWQMVAFY